MLKCLMKYEWVKLRRDTLPAGKGIMGAWAKIAARAVFFARDTPPTVAIRTL